MGFTRKMKTGLANVKKEFAEQTQGSMHTLSPQANTVPHSDLQSDEMRRKPNSGYQVDAAKIQSKATLGRPVSVVKPFNTAPPVPPHRAPSFGALNTSGDETLIKGAQPILLRKPTYSDGLAKKNPVPCEKPLPPPRSTMDSRLPASQDLRMSTHNNHVPQGQSLEVEDDFGDPLSQSAETHSDGMEMVESPEGILNQTIMEQSEKIQEQEHEMKALRDSNSNHLDDVERLKDELRIEKERHAQTTQAWRKATAILSANRPEANYKVDDDTLRKDYHNIIYEVSSWVATFCVPNFEHVPDSELRVFNKLTQHPLKYYGFKRTRELLLQSLVMQVLADLILNRGLYWAGKQSAGLCEVQLALMPGTCHRFLRRMCMKQLAHIKLYAVIQLTVIR